MDSNGTVTRWLHRLKDGDEMAAQELWQTYCERLARLALQHLRTSPRRVADEQDAVLSAFHSFFDGVRRGKFLRLDDRNDLWQILVMLTQRKAADQIVYERRRKRGGGKVRGESAFDDDSASVWRGIERIAGQEPTPADAAQLLEEFNRRLGVLRENLREVAILRLEGHSVEEIAERFQCVPRTIERKLQLIRKAWSEEVQP